MCDFSGRLIAWIDQELPENEATEVERHLATCAWCQTSANAYRRVSAEFHAYCEAAITSNIERNSPHRMKVLSGVVAAAVVVAVLFLTFPHAHVQPTSPHTDSPQAAVVSPVIAVEAARPERVKNVHRRHAVALAKTQDANWLPAAPAIQIAFPAEAIFPPGAVPLGFDFVADVSISADGSAQQLRLRP